MAEAYPQKIRNPVVDAYESGEGGYAIIAKEFVLCPAMVHRLVRLYGSKGDITSRPKGGGTPSGLDAKEISDLLDRLGDATANELTAEFNRKRQGEAKIHVSSMKRAFHRFGYVVKNRYRPLESFHPKVIAKQGAYWRWIGRFPKEKLVFLHESGLNTSMYRSHAWVKRGPNSWSACP
jgi:transposase